MIGKSEAEWWEDVFSDPKKIESVSKEFGLDNDLMTSFSKYKDYFNVKKKKL